MQELDSETLPPPHDAALQADPARLRCLLLDLLPADGTPLAITRLARLAGVATWHITEALLDDYMAGHLDFDVCADTFRRATAQPIHHPL